MPRPTRASKPPPKAAAERRRLLGGLLLLPGSLAWAARAWPPRPDIAATRSAIFVLANRFRAEQGADTLRVQTQLDRAAQAFAEFLAGSDRFEHEADGRSPDERASAAGYDWCMVAENIGFAMSSEGFDAPGLASKLMRGWIDSPGHRHNLLAREALDTGVGIAHGGRSDRYYGVQLFGRAGADCRRRR